MNIFENYRQEWVIGTEIYDGTDSNQIARTFDDGPNEPYTLRILEALAKYGIRATFFMVGKYVRQRPGIVHAVKMAGHVIGNHTDQHPSLKRIEKGQLLVSSAGPIFRKNPCVTWCGASAKV